MISFIKNTAIIWRAIAIFALGMLGLIPISVLYAIHEITSGYILTAIALPLILISIGAFCIVSFSNKRWLVIAVSFFNKSIIPVELIDFEAEREITIAIKKNDGLLYANVFWINNTALPIIVLLPNGKVSRDGEAENCTYHYFWLPLRRSYRTAMLLSNNFSDFNHIRTLEAQCRPLLIYEGYYNYE